MGTLAPRIVLVTRDTAYEALIARHATREAVRFHLSTRGQSLDAVEQQHEAQSAALGRVRADIPRSWRTAAARREALDRFLFEPGDVVVAVGQDGLIANVAKYLRGQPVVGVNPDAGAGGGVLARFTPECAGAAIAAAACGQAQVEARTMVEARLDTGETLLALNEIFVGHRSHQSAIYDVAHGKALERQSSSGLIVASGTGATGWARSIMAATGRAIALDPCAPRAAFFVREAWPSPATGTALVAGEVKPDLPLHATSRMDGGVIFADGIEQDFLRFDWGSRVSIRPADQTLSLVVDR